MTQEDYIDRFAVCMSGIEDDWNGELSANFKRILFEFGQMLVGIDKEAT